LNSLRILILVDGNHRIGMGHVYRSLHLANELKKYKHDTVFLTNTLPAKRILSRQFKCLSLPKLQSRKNKIFSKFHPDIIILDKLKESTNNLKIYSKNCSNIVGIDYTGSNKRLIQYGINMLYQKSGIINNNSFSGFEFAILNKIFTKKKPIHIKKKINSVIVLQGGSDTECFTPKIINALNSLEDNFEITVVLGPAFNCWKKLKKAINENKKRLKIYHNVKNMQRLMSKQDMAITGGGLTLLELCRLGIPSLIVCGAPFENETASMLQRKKFGINLGYGGKLSERKISAATKRLLADYYKRKRMNKIGTSLIDGKGVERVSFIINKIGMEK